MNYNTIIISTILLVAISILVHFTPVFATNSTQTTFCENGICSTGGEPHPFTNSTIGLYAPGLYNGTNPITLQNSQRIGIILSKTCVVMEENHIKNTCLTYDKLKQFDNTNPILSGQWINDTWYHRLSPRVVDAYRFYTNNTIVMVDPDGIFASKALLITITNQNFTWINPDEISNGGLITFTHNNRSVLGCEQATVAPIISLINDTIHYLESGCKTTNYNDTQITTHYNIPFNYNNPYSTLHETSFLTKLLNNHVYNNGNHTSGGYGPIDCITKQCSFIDPYKKPGW